jgi:endonuclease/exonuclease/phosphatase (EEP) superfamily protein YafD
MVKEILPFQKVAWMIACLLLLLTLIAVGCAIGGWSFWPERLVHFQLQYWLGATGLTIGVLLLRDRYPALIALFCWALLSVNILTWYLPIGGATQPWVKVMFANVWETNRNHAPILAQVRAENPDLAVFVEVNQRWRKELDSLSDIFPYSLDNKRGEVLYSKTDLAGVEIVPENPSFVRTLMVRNISQRGKKFTLVVTHPSSPANPAEFDKRNSHLSALAPVLKGLTDNLVVVGDFNTTPWSPYYRQFVDTAGLVNAQQGFGLAPTWTHLAVRKIPGWLQPFLSVPIDHIFTRSGDFKMRSTSFHATANIGSDHVPIVAEIGLVQ